MEGNVGLFLVGVCFAGTGFAFWWRDRKFFKRAIMVRGVVSGIHERQDYDHERNKRQTMYSAIVTFEFDGQTRQVTDSSSSSWKPTLGKERWVGIDPQDIQNARVYSRFWQFFYLIFICLGLVMIGATLYSWLF